MTKTRRFRKRAKGGSKKNKKPLSENNLNVRALMRYEHSEAFRYNIPKRNTITIQNRIQQLLDRQKPLEEELIVYRGQSMNNFINPAKWFSTSLQEKVARYFGYEDLDVNDEDEDEDEEDRRNYGENTRYFVFKIHLQPGIKCLDIHKKYASHDLSFEREYFKTVVKRGRYPNYTFNNIGPVDYTGYDEVLVNGGGTFWRDSEKTLPGFRDTGELVSKLIKGTNIEYGDIVMKVYETYYFP